MSFAKRFPSKACSVSLQALHKEACLAELAALLIESGQVERRLARPLEQAFLERERLASTGVGSGVAIPHVKLAGLDQTALAFAVHKQGVDWASVDGEPAHIFFAVVRPAGPTDRHDPARHLEMMQWIARIARGRDFCRFAMAARTKAELLDLLAEVAPSREGAQT